MTTLYGIKNCDTVKKARKWLDANQQDFTFHDFRVDGLDAKTVQQWLTELGPDTLINKRSTTWKQLDESQKHSVLDNDRNAIEKLLLTHPTLIKRPVLVHKNNLYVGFKADTYATTFSI